ncbi:GNAT family N-acetyltransferase, partial [Agathobacter sp.]|uniref:GNAT family N-acetyltransferase n=1 Tax=Agathobacter sp. TaxID=2021311 RepID=UPI003FD7ABD8
LAGIIGIHEEGSIGMLYVKPQYRHQKLAKALETYALNMALENGWIPYGQIIVGNEPSMRLQESMGMHFSKSSVYWMTKKSSKNTCKSHESVVKYQCCE